MPRGESITGSAMQMPNTAPKCKPLAWEQDDAMLLPGLMRFSKCGNGIRKPIEQYIRRDRGNLAVGVSPT